MTSLVKAEEFGVSVLASDNHRARMKLAGEVAFRIQTFMLEAEEGASVFVTMLKPDMATINREICGGEA